MATTGGSVEDVVLASPERIRSARMTCIVSSRLKLTGEFLKRDTPIGPHKDAVGRKIRRFAPTGGAHR